MQFDDINIFTIVMLVLGLIFIRTLAQTALECMVACENISRSQCAYILCGMEEQPCLYFMRCLLLMFCFSQPVIFSGVHFIRSSQNKSALTTVFSTANTGLEMHCLLKASNESSLWYVGEEDWSKKTIQNKMDACLHLQWRKGVLFELDVMFVILPFAFAVSINCMTWVHFMERGVITPDMVWDDAIDLTLFNYDLSYALECFCANLCFLFLYCAGTGSTTLFVFAAYVTGVEFFFASISKFSGRDWPLNVVAISIFLIILLTWVPIIQSFASILDQFSLVLAIVHGMTLILSIALHLLADGRIVAANLILMRLAITCIRSLSLICFLFLA